MLMLHARLQATSKANSIHTLPVLLAVVLVLRARLQATSKANLTSPRL
jgi:hypothetical protein